jgi:CheY-like chemotaxis protein
MTPQKSAAVLLVEDEDSLRALMRDFLETLGYTVLEARNGTEAIARAEKHRERLSLLLTDVVMPGMSGRVLAERMQALQQTIKVLYISGYTDDAIAHHGVLEPGRMFLQKPFTLDALAEKLSSVLGSDESQRNEAAPSPKRGPGGKRTHPGRR